MANDFSEQLIEACRIILDDCPPTFPGTMENLDRNLLKEEFRKRIFQSHPDRARILGVDEAQLAERSKLLTGAYRLIMQYMESRLRAAPRRGRARSGPARPNGGERPVIDESFFQNLNRYLIPKLPQRIGQYLYRLGVIDFKTLLAAIAWQQQHRPMFGKLALDLDMISNEDFLKIISDKMEGERIGELAVRLGLIQPGDRDRILREQLRRVPRIGGYFVKNSLVTGGELDIVLLQLAEHNRKYAPRHFSDV